MSRHTYPWYTWPGRAVVGLAGLAASVWRDWFHGRTCRNCYHSCATCDSDWFCCRDLGRGYGRSIKPEGHCEYWRQAQ